MAIFEDHGRSGMLPVECWVVPLCTFPEDNIFPSNQNHFVPLAGFQSHVVTEDWLTPSCLQH